MSGSDVKRSSWLAGARFRGEPRVVFTLPSRQQGAYMSTPADRSGIAHSWFRRDCRWQDFFVLSKGASILMHSATCQYVNTMFISFNLERQCLQPGMCSPCLSLPQFIAKSQSTMPTRCWWNASWELYYNVHNDRIVKSISFKAYENEQAIAGMHRQP